MVWTNEDLQKIRCRDPETFEKVYSEYKTKVYNFLVIKTNGNTFLTDDLFSETFHSALLSAPRLKNTRNVLAWLLQIASRRFNDYLRKEYRNKKYLNEAAYSQSSFDNNTEALEKRERDLTLQAAIDTIKPEYRDILRMKYIDMKSQKEIGITINKEVGAVESMLFRAKQALKKELKNYKKFFK